MNLCLPQTVNGPMLVPLAGGQPIPTAPTTLQPHPGQDVASQVFTFNARECCCNIDNSVGKKSLLLFFKKILTSKNKIRSLSNLMRKSALIK